MTEEVGQTTIGLMDFVLLPDGRAGRVMDGPNGLEVRELKGDLPRCRMPVDNDLRFITADYAVTWVDKIAWYVKKAWWERSDEFAREQRALKDAYHLATNAEKERFNSWLISKTRWNEFLPFWEPLVRIFTLRVPTADTREQDILYYIVFRRPAKD